MPAEILVSAGTQSGHDIGFFFGKAYAQFLFLQYLQALLHTTDQKYPSSLPSINVELWYSLTEESDENGQLTCSMKN